MSTVSQAALVRARNGETALQDEDAEDQIKHADVVVKGRNVEVPDHFRLHVEEKLTKLERFHHDVYLFDVELHHEKNRRQAKRCQRLEITVRGKGPVIRSEASAESFYAALEMAADKLESRFRKYRDRRKVHHGTRTPISVAEATADLTNSFAETELSSRRTADSAESLKADVSTNGQYEADEYPGPGHIVRTKVHSSKPMTVDEALYEMELVGHDFYLFHDVDSDTPSVVYRRHAFDYGLIRLA
ncbi:ribosome hibernation-promoting factor, HPF/YfiA family [Hoyosella rhizosphaerae]|uniref:Ribosome hibernation promoting factor n=1 Tax=Hoyosella rhizosphaerae TaxID=1755582 RepID=A0A916XEP3_9ACTN|nr:ribosomal subunit interface protein [Hoyosella rhizosphaerae]